MQKNQGYTQFPNKDLEAIITTRMSAIEIRVLLLIHRKTRGFRRNNCIFDCGNIASWMGIGKSSLYRALASLEKRGVIKSTSDGRYCRLMLMENEMVTLWPIPSSENESEINPKNEKTIPKNEKTIPSDEKTIANAENAHLSRQKKTLKTNAKGVGEQTALDIFNRITGKTIAMSPVIRDVIQARQKEGYDEEQFEMAARMCHAAWGKDAKMCSNVVPKTVFGKRMGEWIQMMSAEQLAIKERRYDEIEF